MPPVGILKEEVGLMQGDELEKVLNDFEEVFNEPKELPLV